MAVKFPKQGGNPLRLASWIKEPIVANQIAIVDAGCFDSLPAVGPLSAADLRAAAVQGQQQLGCN